MSQLQFCCARKLARQNRGVLLKLSLLTGMPLFNSRILGEPVDFVLRNNGLINLETLLYHFMHIAKYFDILKRFGVDQQCDRQTDGRTDGQHYSSNGGRLTTRAKNQ